MSPSGVTGSNQESLSSSETAVYLGIKSWRRYDEDMSGSD
jgi:hypothetical protein